MIDGYASVFYQEGDSGTQYEIGQNFVERIMPGAFDRAVAREEDVVGLFNHDPSAVLGRRSSGTLRLKIDKVGLHYEIDPADTQISRDVVEHQKRGDLVGSSFGFAVDDERTVKDGNLVVREIHSVRLRDVGPVTFPAYSGTANVRYVTPEGRCMVIPEEVCCELRSEMADKLQVAARIKEIDAWESSHNIDKC